jgi:small-conductance mechanosensitive channel
MFETRSHSWLEAGLPINAIDRQAVRRAWRRGLAFLVLIVGVLAVAANREQIVGTHIAKIATNPSRYGPVSNSPGESTAIQIGVVVALLILGWALAAELGRAVGPTLFRRMDPATAGTVGFFTRLFVMAIVLFVALGTAGINTASLAIGATFLAVVFGLAAQQTLGNVIAGVVLLSARPFRVGERVRLQAGGVGGQLEGVVSSLGLLYTSFATGEDLTMVPNSVVLNSAVMPLREPDAVDLRARLRAGVTPRQLQRLLEDAIQTPLRDAPRITLEELDGDEVIVRILATPRHAVDGPALATEVLEAVSGETRAAEERSGLGEPVADDGGLASGAPAAVRAESGDGEPAADDDDRASRAPAAVRAPPDDGASTEAVPAAEAPTAVRAPGGNGAPRRPEDAPAAVPPPRR